MSSEHFYLAYGSNMDPERLKGRLGPDLLDPLHVPSATVVLPRRLLLFRKRLINGSAAADLALRQDGDARPEAEAVVWRVTESGLAKLDVFEGVGIGQYRRESWTVPANEGGRLGVFVYLAEPDVIVDDLLPRYGYLQHVLTGAKKFLSAEYADWISKTKSVEAGDD